MSRIFLSHSSVDEREAIAIKQWLAENGWDDVFLDIDSERGLVAGERWQEALRKAADRCEAVVFIVSPAWAKSKWCLAEFLLAKSLHKLIFGVVLKEVGIDELPTEMTSEWQLCRLVGSGRTEAIHFTHRETPDDIAFLADGLTRLKEGLRKAGLSADFFPWPPRDDPERAPYRGLEPLDARDAAVFFGRDVEIVRGLDALRGMRHSIEKKLFVILGASGSGKSSFLRAGLLPRLARDDRHFFPLAPIRPERVPLYGERGLAHSLHRAHFELKLRSTRLGDIKAQLREGPSSLARLLQQVQDTARARTHALPDGASTPTLILPIDQAEELFHADANDEARSFLQMIGEVLRPDHTDDQSDIGQVRMIVAVTIRSDRYEPLQSAPELAGLQSVVFDDLKPMPATHFREVILGPAKRASEQGRRLAVEPYLVDKLVGECKEGGDTLPLLGLALARLYRDYGADGFLRLDEYEAMGGLASIVKTEAESVLSFDDATREQQLKSLSAAFIPWLATINPQNDQPMRRVARRADLPPDSLPLIDAFAEKRLLLTDQRGGETVVEVAHEALLRQWDVLVKWLDTQREDLKDADVLERAALAWVKSGRKDPWLMEGERLANAESLSTKAGFSMRLDACRKFLLASRRRENGRRTEEEQRRQAELEAAKKLAAEQAARADAEVKVKTVALASASRIRKRSQALAGALTVTLVALVFGGWALIRSKEQFTRATGLRLVAEEQAMFSGAHSGGDERALLQLLAAHRIARGPEMDEGLLAALIHHRPLRKLITTGAPIKAAAFSTDGNQVIVFGSDNTLRLSDNTLRLLDIKTGQFIGAPLEGHESLVTSVAFSPDGTRIASGDIDRTIRLWDAKTGQPIGVPLEGHKATVESVAFSPDGSRIVSGSGDNTVRVWDAKTGQPVGAPLEGHKGTVWSVAFSPDGSRIVSASHDKTLRLWDALVGRTTAVLTGHADRIWSVAFSPDGNRIVSGSADKTLRLWDATTGQPIGAPLDGHKDWVLSVAFSPDGSRIVSGSGDRTLRLWDGKTGLPIGMPLEGHKAPVRSVAFSPDGGHILSGSEDQTLRLWDEDTGRSLGAWFQGHTKSVTRVAFSPDGSRFVSASDDKTLRLWDAKTGQPIGAPLEGHREPVTSVAFSPDGKRIVSGSRDKTLRLWDAKTMQPIGAPLEGHKKAVEAVAFSTDGSRIISGGDDTTSMQLWDAKTGGRIGPWLKGPARSMNTIAISRDGHRAVTGGGDESLHLWDAKTGLPIGAPLEGHESPVISLDFSPDGNRIVSGSLDNTVRLWDTKAGQPIGAPLAGHTYPVESVAFCPDGSCIASGGMDATLRLWDAKTGQPIGAPLRHSASVTSVAFSPDGKLIVTGSADGTLRLWPAPKVWPDELCAKLTRNMSPKEWREWVSPDIDYVIQCPGLRIPPDAVDRRSNKTSDLNVEK